MPLARRTVALHLSESITETADQPALPLSESITRAADQPVLPLILEKPAAAAPVPSLVWQKSFATSTSTTGAGNPEMTDVTRAVAVAAYPVAGGMLSTAPPIMRAESTNLSADDQPGASAPTSRPFQATALDWDSLLAQVSRRLLRQLAIERERRGGKKWS
jgi:hypothetical protein